MLIVGLFAAVLLGYALVSQIAGNVERHPADLQSRRRGSSSVSPRPRSPPATWPARSCVWSASSPSCCACSRMRRGSTSGLSAGSACRAYLGSSPSGLPLTIPPGASRSPLVILPEFGLPDRLSAGGPPGADRCRASVPQWSPTPGSRCASARRSTWSPVSTTASSRHSCCSRSPWPRRNPGWEDPAWVRFALSRRVGLGVIVGIVLGVGGALPRCVGRCRSISSRRFRPMGHRPGPRGHRVDADAGDWRERLHRGIHGRPGRDG